MKRWGDGAFDAYLPAETVLRQVETAVIATDRASNLLYANAHAAKLFGFPKDFHHLIGHSILQMGFEKADLVKATGLAKQVLRGLVWEGTFVSVRQDGSRVFVRAQAAPLRHPVRGDRRDRHLRPRGDAARERAGVRQDRAARADR